MLGVKRLGLVMAGVSLVVGAGCAKTDDDVDAKTDDFSVLPVDKWSSILPAIENAEGAPDVCVGLIGYSAAEAPAIFQQVTTQISSAANAWNDTLANNPLWTFKGVVAPNYRMQLTECKDTLWSGFSVNLWKDVQRFKNEWCYANGMAEANCSSAAMPNRRIFYMGPWNRTQVVSALDGFTSLHEYGHLLGLGDTYRIDGVNEFKGEQPAAVMNGFSYTLTDDDRMGLAATLRAVKTGYRSCDGIAKPADFEVNGFGAILCNATATPVTNHPGRATDPVIPTPPDGPIPASTLAEINAYQVAALQLNCRAGAGTEYPVVLQLDHGAPLTASPGFVFQPRIALSTQQKPWLLVNVNGQACYTSASLQFITPIGAIPQSTLNQVNDYAVEAIQLNCRSGAGTEFPVVQTLMMGDSMKALTGAGRIANSTIGNPWLHVTANGLSCYASANFQFIVPQP